MKLIAGVLSVVSGLAAMTMSAEANMVTLHCSGGGSMQIQNIPNNWVITFERASQPASVAPPGPGECALFEVALPDGSATTMTLPKVTKNALLLLAAAKGGNFQAEVFGQNGTLVIGSIGQVNVVDSEPLSPGPDGDDEAGDEAAGGGDICGPAGGTATVVIENPKLKKLNVRTKPGGKVIGSVPEGEQVTLVGPCGGEEAAGLVASEEEEDWCQIDQPLEGCVMAKFLEFEGGLLDDAAGIAQ